MKDIYNTKSIYLIVTVLIVAVIEKNRRTRTIFFIVLNIYVGNSIHLGSVIMSYILHDDFMTSFH